MDQELKAYLDGKFDSITSEFVTVSAKFASIDIKFAAIDAQFAAMNTRFTEVRAEIEASETRLLTEFWKWGRSADQRMRRVEHSDATTTERLAAMEERIFTLERKAAGGKS